MTGMLVWSLSHSSTLPQGIDRISKATVGSGGLTGSALAAGLPAGAGGSSALFILSGSTAWAATAQAARSPTAARKRYRGPAPAGSVFMPVPSIRGGCAPATHGSRAYPVSHCTRKPEDGRQDADDGTPDFRIIGRSRLPS